jgi:hypothetical protein
MKERNKLKSLPIGVSTFESIITSNALYVDKTQQIYQLLKPNSRYFLSRPRRFGKSLTCSTLATIFEGRRELFKDLWIGQSNYTWEKHPVVRFDFSRISHQNRESLILGLHSALDNRAQTDEITLSEKQLKEKFAELIKKLAHKHGRVVVIIDEYDKPITDLIDSPEQAELVRAELRNFYGTLKGEDVDAVLHFLFVTGVSKFAKVSLFSEFNNLNDITMDEKFATIVGYTQQEVETYLEDHIKQLAEKEQASYEQTLVKLKKWYNGFCFSSEGNQIKTYNPLSLHKCLDSQRFSNYWFASGTPNFLVKIFKKEPSTVKNFVAQEAWEITASGMEAFSPEVYYKKIIPLLLQTGYLTIKSYDDVERNYTLDYPNYEVRLSMTEQIMEYIAHIPDVMLGKFIARFTRALQADNIDEYCSTFRDYLKLIPHNIVVDREKFFQATFYGTALLIDTHAVVSEVATDRGFVDIVLHGANKIFVMEFKKDKSPETALQQIITKKYYEKYVIEGKQIALVGINFDLEVDGVDVAWVIKAFLPSMSKQHPFSSA